MEFFLGVVGVALAWTLAASQWWRARTHIEGISAASWAIFFGVNFGWLGYGVASGAWHLVANAAIAASFNVALLFTLRAHRWLVVGAAAGLSVVGVGGALSWTLTVAAVTVGAVALRWPQIVLLVKAPSVVGVSAVSWGAALVNNFVWTGYWAVRSDVVMLVSSALITAVTLLLFVLLWWRRARPHPPDQSLVGGEELSEGPFVAGARPAGSGANASSDST